MRTTSAPTPFHPELDALALQAAGFTVERVPAFWEDVGGPESGPKLIGYPAHDRWTSPPTARGGVWEVIVVDGHLEHMEHLPFNPFGDDDAPF